jgi:dephospho-CoA kinase
MLTVGLTGGIGSGKTTVSDLFAERGVAIIDTDVIAHQLVNENKSILKQISRTFGDAVLLDSGELDRKQLATIVFNDRHAKQQLENILHPAIRAVVKQQIQSLDRHNHTSGAHISDNTPYAIVVIPLLFETGFHDLIDRILVVTADEDIRIRRVKQRDDRSEDEIRSIIHHQVSDETRINGADDIIQNDNDFNDLRDQVHQLHKKYSRLALQA